MKNWFYEFFKRKSLNIHTRKRKTQITELAMKSVKHNYWHSAINSYCNLIINPKYPKYGCDWIVSELCVESCCTCEQRKDSFYHSLKIIINIFYNCCSNRNGWKQITLHMLFLKVRHVEIFKDLF